jgi:hypothetical protein
VSRDRRFLLGGLLLALLLAGVVSFWASGSPDGLNRAAIDTGFARSQSEHRMAGGPLAGYGTRGLQDAWLSNAVAGTAGVGITLAVGAGLFLLLRPRRSQQHRDPAA